MGTNNLSNVLHLFSIIMKENFRKKYACVFSMEIRVIHKELYYGVLRLKTFSHRVYHVVFGNRTKGLCIEIGPLRITRDSHIHDIVFLVFYDRVSSKQ